jgi:2-haloacid dehalogenase
MPITACIFDAYGTLLDVTAAARGVAHAGEFPAIEDIWQDLAADWRNKQLDYTWLHAATGAHADFWRLTQDSLDWVLEYHGLFDPALRAALLDLYVHLDAFPDAHSTLGALKAAGYATAILSNGTPEMLHAACSRARLSPHLDDILSVQAAGVFKPDPRVYALVEGRFAVPPSDTLFVSANGWDAAAASGFGFHSIWINRTGDPVERLPWRPHKILTDLSDIPQYVSTL